MAVYESRVTDARGFEQVSDYLFDLNERIKYYFQALTPEDNFTFEAYQSYRQNGVTVGIFEQTENGLQNTISDYSEETYSQVQLFNEHIGMLVNKGGVTAALNIESEDINIKGDRLQITGSNLNLTLDGDLLFRGEVIADLGDIGGWFIAGGEDQKYIGGTSDSKITVDSLESDEEMSFNDVNVHGPTDLSRSDIELSGAIIETDKSTIFEDGFSGWSIDCHTYMVVCGAARAYTEVNVNGQITCATCYTSADGSTWSDARLKKDIKDISLEESKKVLTAADPFIYDRIDTKEHQAGFMAQDLVMADPERMYGIWNKRNGFYQVSYKALIPFLVKELQQQTKEIEEICSRTS